MPYNSRPQFAATMGRTAPEQEKHPRHADRPLARRRFRYQGTGSRYWGEKSATDGDVGPVSADRVLPRYAGRSWCRIYKLPLYKPSHDLRRYLRERARYQSWKPLSPPSLAIVSRPDLEFGSRSFLVA